MALKVGIVGARGIGMTHAEAYSNCSLGELVAICDVVKDRATAGADKYGTRAYTSVAQMLRNEPEIDIVDVCTGGYENGSWHFEPVMEAIAAGKHVLVEKPISNDIGEARQMVAAAAENKVYLGCNLNHFFTPPAEKAKEYMDSGQVGELVYCLHKMGFSAGEGTYSPTASSRFRGFPYAHFKAFLTHPFSVMRHFCGDITHVQAFVNRPWFRRKASDVMLSTVSIHVRFANDAVGYLLSQRGDATYGLGGWWSVEVAGTLGTFCIENCIEKLTFWPAPSPSNAGDPSKMSGGGSRDPEVTNSGIVDFSQTFSRRIHAFLEDVTNGVPLESVRASGHDALAVLEYTWAVIESYEQGGVLVRPHPLPPLHGDPASLLD
ncbi:MAG TPA: Gfo/Idh/MocA family oxidoreductase [Chthonomonadales bacterium]|nr:Gfo/Idh/MocA family oxidoreductase [Chthonomonadales bacterium]